MSAKSESAIVFEGDDVGYLEWLSAHPEGYVLNTRRPNGDPDYIVLHRATCRHISRGTHRHGAWTERKYLKICAISLSELQSVAQRFGSRDGSFSKACSFCA